LSDIQTQNIVAVDLNSILQINAMTLSTWFEQMGNKNKAEKYYSYAKDLLESIQEVRIIK